VDSRGATCWQGQTALQGAGSLNTANGSGRGIYATTTKEKHHRIPRKPPDLHRSLSPSSWVLTHVPQFELTHGPLVGAALCQQVDPDLPVGHWGRFRWPVMITEDLKHRQDGVPVSPVMAQVPPGDLPAPREHLESSSCTGSQGRSCGAGRDVAPSHQEVCTVLPHFPFVWISASSREKDLWVSSSLETGGTVPVRCLIQRQAVISDATEISERDGHCSSKAPVLPLPTPSQH